MGQKVGAAVGAHHERGRVAGLAEDDAARRRGDRPDDGGDDPVLDQGVEQASSEESTSVGDRPATA